MRVECAPAFHYALAEHRTSLIHDDSIPANGEYVPDRQKKALFKSDDLTLDLRFIAESVMDCVPPPAVELCTLDLRPQGHKGISISADLDLVEGQIVTFVLRTPPKATTEQTSREQSIATPANDEAQQLRGTFNRGSDHSHESTQHRLGQGELSSGPTNFRNKSDPPLTKVVISLFGSSWLSLTFPKDLLRGLLKGTSDYWNAWIRRSTYNGSWKEAVHRSALALKLLIYEPTGLFVLISGFMPQLFGRCCGCQPNVQSTGVYWWNQKLVRF
jgi:hypothetical protein